MCGGRLIITCERQGQGATTCVCVIPCPCRSTGSRPAKWYRHLGAQAGWQRRPAASRTRASAALPHRLRCLPMAPPCRPHLLPHAAAARVSEVVHLIQHHQPHILQPRKAKAGSSAAIGAGACQPKESQQGSRPSSHATTATHLPACIPLSRTTIHKPTTRLLTRAHAHATPLPSTPAVPTFRRSSAVRPSSSTRYSMLRSISVVMTTTCRKAAGQQAQGRSGGRCG